MELLTQWETSGIWCHDLSGQRLSIVTIEEDEIQQELAAVVNQKIPSSMANIDDGPNSKLPFGSSETTTTPLPAIDETRPDNLSEETTKVEVIDEGKLLRSNNSSRPVSPCRKHKAGMKGRLRGLKDKYVSCLQAIDAGAGDMRSCAASGGGPALAPPAASQPFDCVTTAASATTPNTPNTVGD